MESMAKAGAARAATGTAAASLTKAALVTVEMKFKRGKPKVRKTTGLHIIQFNDFRYNNYTQRYTWKVLDDSYTSDFGGGVVSIQRTLSA